MFKKNGGFTLVELIVVIAILAILAGVAVPAYTGYIEKANNTACLAELSAIQTAAQSACAMNGKALESVTVTQDGNISMVPAAGDDEVDWDDFYTKPSNLSTMMGKHSDYKTAGAKWTATAGTWAKNS